MGRPKETFTVLTHTALPITGGILVPPLWAAAPGLRTSFHLDSTPGSFPRNTLAKPKQMGICHPEQQPGIAEGQWHWELMGSRDQGGPLGLYWHQWQWGHSRAGTWAGDTG